MILKEDGDFMIIQEAFKMKLAKHWQGQFVMDPSWALSLSLNVITCDSIQLTKKVKNEKLPKKNIFLLVVASF